MEVNDMKKQNKLAVAIALAFTTGSLPLTAAQSQADFQDTEYYASKGLDLINAAEAYAMGYTGKAVTLGICDEPANFLSPEFSTKQSSKIVDTASIEGSLPGVYDWKLTHGTHVAGIAAASRNGIGMQGVAYEAEAASANHWSLYVPNGGSYQYEEESKNFFRYYLEHPEIKVINNSWGANLYTDKVKIDESVYQGLSDMIHARQEYGFSQVIAAAKQDKLLVFCAGNDGHASPEMEALLGYWDSSARSNILTVTALDGFTTRSSGMIAATQQNSGVMSCFSNLSQYVEDSTLAASGYLILSANANYAADGSLDVLDSGSSMAAPFVTGTGALVQQAFPYLSAKQIGDVLLSTANSKLEYSRGYVAQLQREDTGWQLNFFVLDPQLKSLSKEELLEKYHTYLANCVSDSWVEKTRIRSKIAEEENLVNIYEDVSLQELIGQGVVDAGAAVCGPGAFNARRLNASDISGSYTVNGTSQQQALYRVDTQGYDSVWSNDIKEIKAGYIASDSTEADLRARWKYYDTNWLSYTGTDRDAAKITTRTLVDVYNQQVAASGLAGLHVGLYKAGAGTLVLTGTNTYAGSSVAAGGTLEIDGSAAGDAWSITDSSAGTTGTISGSGTIKGNLYNHGIAQPTSAGNLTVNGSLVSDGSLGLVTANNGQTVRQIIVGGTADIAGSKLVPVAGSLYLPGRNYSFLQAAGGITGCMTTAFSGLLNADITASSDGTKQTAVLHTADNVGGLNALQQGALNSLSELALAAASDSTKSSQVQSVLLLNGDTARSALQSVAGNIAPDASALVVSNMTAMNAIGARLGYLATDSALTGTSKARADEDTTKEARIIPIDMGATSSGWLKFSKSWESLGRDATSGHGSAISIGFDHKVNADWRVGEFFTYGKNSFSAGAGNLDNTDCRLGVYGMREKGPQQTFVYFDIGRQTNDSKRYISAVGNYLANSSYKSRTIELGARYSYDLDYAKEGGWHKKPYAEAQIVHYRQDGYTEGDAGVWNQTVKSENTTYSAVTLGMSMEKKNADSDVELRAGYKRVLSGNDPAYRVHFTDAAESGFTVHGSSLDKNLIVLGVHAGQEMGSDWRLEGDLQLEKGSPEKNLQASVMVKKSW